MRLIVGLGNPGLEYKDTRHNIGFEVMDRLAKKRDLNFDRFKAGWLKGKIGEIAMARNADYALLKPFTYMNRSGEVIAAAVSRFGLKPEEIFIVVDDLALPLGRLRVRKSGSSGGHNGLASIESALGSQDYPRLRFGIGAANGKASEHVLGQFHAREQLDLEEGLQRAVAAVELFIDSGDMNRCMNEFNQKEKE